MDPETGSRRKRLTSGQGTRSARCGESRTPGAGGDPRETDRRQHRHRARGSTSPDTPRRRSWRTGPASSSPRTTTTAPALPRPCPGRRRHSRPPARTGRRQPSRTGCVTSAAASAAWSRGPGNATAPCTSCSRPANRLVPSAGPWAWTARPCGGSPANPASKSSWSRPPAGNPGSTRSSPSSTSGGTRASPTPPYCTPSCKARAGQAACRPCAATSARSAPRPARRHQPPQCPSPARSPAGYCPGPDISSPASGTSSPPSRTAARTWTPSPATCAASPR